MYDVVCIWWVHKELLSSGISLNLLKIEVVCSINSSNPRVWDTLPQEDE